jgi:hypothetical protein
MSEPLNRSELRAELRAFRAEVRLLIIAAVLAGPVLSNVALSDTAHAISVVGVLVGGLAVKLLWLK